MLSCLHESVQSAHVCTRCLDLFDASWHRHVAAAEAIDGIFADSIVLFVQLPVVLVVVAAKKLVPPRG